MGCISVLARLANLGVCVLGLALAGYSIYLLTQQSLTARFAGASLGWGIFDAVFCGFVALCGMRSRCFVTLYLLAMTITEAAVLTAAVLFRIPKFQQELINDIQPPPQLVDDVNRYIDVASIVFLGVALFRLVAVVLVLLNACCCKGGRKAEEEELLEGLLARYTIRKQEMLEQSRSRYREQNADLYQKYGIQRGNNLAPNEIRIL